MSDEIWSPSLDGSTRIERFAALHGASDYDELYAWSVRDLNGFWQAVVDFFDLPHSGSISPALASAAMPGARWFPDLRLNYAECALRLPGRADDDVVVVAESDTRATSTLTAAELRAAVASARAGLIEAGIGHGDRVAAYAPNLPETLVLLLASASLGATFSSCAPEFGTQSVVDRWQQIEPSLLMVVDGYRYGAKAVDRRAEVAAIRAALPSVRTTVWLPYLSESADVPEDVVSWADFTAGRGELAFERVPFDHPLYVLFSSGTTGLPKPIVHGHGGITVEHVKALGLHQDLGPDDRFFWYSTTGWMMWNYLVSGLLVGSTIVLHDGAASTTGLWQLAAEHEISVFGTSAPWLMACRKADVVPPSLPALRALGSTGAPLPAEGYEWAAAMLHGVQVVSISGGTDVCSAFVGAAPTVPVWSGEISCRMLGCAVEAYLDGHPVIGETGELVITAPMPSMPVGFWGDDDGSRYRAAYFADIEGVWRHGDWITITERGSCIITGRSDATLNRGGVRLGTAEFYAVAESVDAVRDSLVIHLEEAGTAGRLLLFVALEPGVELDEDLRAELKRALSSRLSPRHVPDDILQVRALPRTLSGKKLEVPVKRILLGADPATAAAAGALSDPAALAEFVALRERL